jgi:hypothetical protein
MTILTFNIYPSAPHGRPSHRKDGLGIVQAKLRSWYV